MTETMNRTAARAARRCLVALVALAAAPFANADTVVLEATSYITGTQSSVYQLSLAGPGTLSVKLSDLNWPERLSGLSFALTTASGVLARLDGEGTTQLDLTNGGMYYAIVAGTGQGMWNAGMYSLRMGFDQVAPVPLPAGVWMLLSGVAGLFGIARIRLGVPAALSPAH